MMTVWKDLPETETNHDINEIGKAYNQSAFIMPTIPKSSNIFTWQQMSENQTRHDAQIYELEPADYTVIICAYPQEVSLKRIGSIFEIITFRKLMSREDFSFIALQRISMLHHSNNQTRNQFINLCKAKVRNKIVRNTISFDNLPHLKLLNFTTNRPLPTVTGRRPLQKFMQK